MSDVKIEDRGLVRWITIDRETRRNALNAEVVARIGEAIDTAGSDAALRAIVITGTGNNAFCAGADLQKNAEGSVFAIDYANPSHYLVTLFRQMQACRLPIIARVNGHAMAGGFGLLCACDMAVVAAEATLGTPEAKVGIVPMMILPGMIRTVPRAKLMEMCFTGEPLTAAEALEAGIVNYVVPRAELDAKLDWLLARITDKSPTGIRIGKQAYNAMRDMGLSEALEYAQVMLVSMTSTEDAREGMAAFQEKRAPVWTGR